MMTPGWGLNRSPIRSGGPATTLAPQAPEFIH